MQEAFPRDPTTEIDIQTIKQKSVSGVAALTLRTLVLQTISLVAFGFFGAVFASDEWGTYVLILAAKNFLGYFSDIGLAGALIQKKDQLTKDDLATTFWVQQVLILCLLLVLFLLTPHFQNLYQLSSDGIILLWAFGLSLFVSSLKTIPTVLMERKMDFGRWIIPQISESLLFNGLAVFLAIRGFGLTSFTTAIVASSLVSLGLTFLLQPWKPSFSFSKESLKGLLKFGVPYQANTFLAMVKDDGLILVLGIILGKTGIGLLIWAQKWGLAPLRFFMDQVIKVTFPAFSRLQEDKEHLRSALTQSIFFICFLVFPSIVGLVLLAPIIIEVVPRYEQWKPAIFALAMFGINAAWAAVTTPLTNVLNAIGKIKVTFWLMVMWTILSWVLMPSLAYLYGVNGAALGSALVASSSIVAIIIARRFADFDLELSVFKPLIAAVGMGIVLLLVRGLIAPSPQWISVLVVFGVLTYLLAVTLLVGPILLANAKKVVYAAFGKH